MTLRIMRILREAALFIFILWTVSTIISYIRAPKLDSSTLPHIKGRLTDGKQFDSDDLKGKPLMVEFWGTWCPVCKQQASNVSSVAKKYNIITIAVNSRSDEYINRWLKDHKVTYPVLNDPGGAWANRFKVTVYPTTFFYDTKGELRFTEVGYTTTAGMLARLKMSE